MARNRFPMRHPNTEHEAESEQQGNWYLATRPTLESARFQHVWLCRQTNVESPESAGEFCFQGFRLLHSQRDPSSRLPTTIPQLARLRLVARQRVLRFLEARTRKIHMD